MDGLPPTALILHDVDGWYLRWQDGDLYWVDVYLESSEEEEAHAEAVRWLTEKTRLITLP